MGRTPRKRSESDVYHVFARGVGRMQIFEDADDNRYALDLLKRMSLEEGCSVLAYCLMGNHFHLLVKMSMEDLSEAMRRFEVSYAQYFNGKYERVGTLFQGRFGSEPITSDEQLLAAVRYIHLNPTKAGIAPFDAFEWSSYREYAQGGEIADTSLILEMIGGTSQLERFHRTERGDATFMEESSGSGMPRRARQTDQRVRGIIEDALGQRGLSNPSEMPRDDRDAMLIAMRDSGATVRQAERLTGISRGVIGRVWRNAPIEKK